MVDNNPIEKLLTPDGLSLLEGELKKTEGKGDPELGELCKNTEKPLVDIDLTEQGVFSWPHKEIEGWRFYRAEYGGCNEDCYYEGSVWLPPEVDSWKWTQMFEILQVPEARRKFEEAIVKIHKEDVCEKSNWRSL